MQHITVPLPDGISTTDARRIGNLVERAVTRVTGALVETSITDLILSHQERRILRTALDVALAAPQIKHDPMSAPVLADLRERVSPDSRHAIVAETLRDFAGDHDELSRPQHCAADAMAAEYGRSHVRHLADGAVVITGLTDDIERRSVCIERDGRERWRS